MKNTDYSRRTVWFALAVICGVVALGLVPEFKLFGMTMVRVDILSELRDNDGLAEEAVEYEPNFALLEEELAKVSAPSVVEADSLVVEVPVCYEWTIAERESLARARVHSDDVRVANRAGVVAFEDFDTLSTTRLDSFIEKLASGESVRIAFLGDSFIEGDIVTSDLREELQSRFGGRGVGFVPADIPFATVRKSVKRTSSGWKTYSVMKPKEATEVVRDRFFISGYLADGRVGATTRWQATNAFSSLDSCSRARILFISRDTSRVEVVVADTLRREFEIAGDERMRQIYVEGPVDNIRLRVLDGAVLCYGATMDGDGGVAVDNFSVRSNNGHAIFGTSATVNRQIDDMLGYDLVVLQYGLNIMQQGQRVYAKYRDQLRNMIAYAERSFPNAAIVVMGVSDRWVKSAESGEYEPIGSVDALTSYQRAAADSCGVAFWNTSRVMANLGGMPEFVAKGWAAKDYTHINYAGGRRIARALAETLCAEVYDYLVALEEAERLEAERLRQEELEREMEAQRRLDEQIDAVSPVIDSLTWPLD